MKTWLLKGCWLWAIIVLPAWTAMAAAPVLIEWHQQACQFMEAEGRDLAYVSTRAEDCIAINDHDGEQRLAVSPRIQIKAGEYVFRIYNDDVPYALGFWLRGQGLARLTLPSISGGGIEAGGFKDYRISLKPGKYWYSCPLNPTPDYTLTVVAP
jgi:hypothetical protein